MSGIPSPLKSPTAMVYPWLDSDCLARVSNCAHVGMAGPATANQAAKAYSTRRNRKGCSQDTANLTPLLCWTAQRQGEPLTSRQAYHDFHASPISLSSRY